MYCSHFEHRSPLACSHPAHSSHETSRKSL